MKIVVTGALGHIGSHLIRRFPDFFPDCEVVMIDNLATQRFASLFALPDNAKYRFIEGDVTTMGLESLFAGADAVVQLAAITDATSSFERAAEVERVNLTATKRVADACIATGVPMIMASSTSVYGTQESRVDEECSPDELKPQSPYAETKLKEEALTRKKCDEKLRAIILRYGTIFGVSPGMRFHTAVNKFCWQAVMGIPLTIWKTAYDQKRPYLHLDDCVRAIAFAIEKNLFDGRVYNVVTTNATVKEVTEEIRNHIPDLSINFVEHKIMNQLSYEVLNTRIKEAGFKIERDLRQGIEDSINLIKRSNVINFTEDE
jgi:UDP-glucose 4-epimerase